MSVYLKKLSLEDGEEYFSMLKSIGTSENAFSNPVHDMTFEQFLLWRNERYQWDHGENLPKNYVRQTIYWLCVDETPVGIGKLRHALTDESRVFGGNIGYAIAPIYRGKGYGNVILKLLLDEANKNSVFEK